MNRLDDGKRRTKVRHQAPVAQRIEQRFPKRILGESTRPAKVNKAAASTNSLAEVTSSGGSCDLFGPGDTYSGRDLAPLWKLANRNGNELLRRLVLRYEAEVEGIEIGGQRCA